MDYKERIRALREDNDYTQSRIAGLLNIGQNTYADYELGKTRIPVDSLIKLAQFYDVDMNYITDISKTVHKFPKEKQQLAAVNKRKKIVIPEHTLHCCQFFFKRVYEANDTGTPFLYGRLELSKTGYQTGNLLLCHCLKVRRQVFRRRNPVLHGFHKPG